MQSIDRMSQSIETLESHLKELRQDLDLMRRVLDDKPHTETRIQLMARRVESSMQSTCETIKSVKNRVRECEMSEPPKKKSKST